DYTQFCITAPTDPRLGSVSGSQLCGLYDVNPNKFTAVQNVRLLAKDVPGATGEPKEVFNGVDFSVNARFGKGGGLMGGGTVGRTTYNLCWQNSLPNVATLQGGSAGSQLPNLSRTNQFCEITPSWWDGIGSQVKFQVVYPLPYGFVASGTFKDQPGIPDQST